MSSSFSIIIALISAQWKSLIRDRIALLLTFVVPCVLFTVLAIIFGGVSSGPGAGGDCRWRGGAGVLPRGPGGRQ